MSPVNIKLLEPLKTLGCVPAPQLEKLAANLSVKTFEKNDIVFDQDEEARLIYLLISGVARLSHLSSQERQTIVSLLPAGRFFGFDSLMPQARHAFKCDAFDDCAIGSMKPHTFVEIFLVTPYDSVVRWYGMAKQPGKASYVHGMKGIGLDLRRRLGLGLRKLAKRFGTRDPRVVWIALNSC